MPRGRKNRKAIHFDLYADKIAAVPGFEGTPGRLKAYRAVGRAMKECGFSHQQGSGYHSNEPLGDSEILRVVRMLDEKLPWFSSCIKKVNIMDVPDTLYDLQNLFVEAARDRVTRDAPAVKPVKSERA